MRAQNNEWVEKRFSNIEKVLKGFAIGTMTLTTICICISAVLSCIGGVIGAMIWIADSSGSLALFLFPVVLIGCVIVCAIGAIAAILTAWLICAFVYGFGELLERVGAVKENTDLLTKQLRAEEKRAKQEVAERAKQEAARAQKKAEEERAKRAAAIQEAEDFGDIQEAAEQADGTAEEITHISSTANTPPLAAKLRYALRITTDYGLISYLKNSDNIWLQEISNESPQTIRELIKKKLEES